MDKSTNSSCLSYLSLESKMDAWAKYAEILIYTSTDSNFGADMADLRSVKG